MSNNTAENSLESLDGEERGMPSVNETGGVSRGQKLGFILLVVLSLAFLIGMTLYNRKSADTGAKTSELQDSTLPTKTFDMPPLPSPGSQASSPVAAAPMPLPAQALPGSQASSNGPELDKSGVSLLSAAVSTSTNAQTPPAEDAPMGVSGTDTGAATSASPGQAILASASYIGNQNLLLAKGAFLDCVLQTRLDSTVPGMSSCVLSRNIYSDNGRVLLLERGSQIVGEYKSDVQQGHARIFVLWTRVKTPNGVIIGLDSPGTDSLGGSGLPGHVNTHFWKRFGGAILLSVLDDGLTYLANRADGGRNTGRGNNWENTQGNAQTLATEALRNSINIPPTLYINQGSRINIYVARDLDFSGVYDVQPR